VFVHAEAHYLEFNMAASVQGWRKKWFYIKDQKNSSSDHYGIALFDANKDLTKLSSWDSPPTEAEIEDIKPLLARIQSLKSATGSALSGRNSWHSFCRGAFSLFNNVFPSCGHPLARRILLECPKRT
jgi:hypothetical protein